MKVVIIGGVAGGATAAARIRRLDEKADIIVFEKGEFVSFANCGLPYHISKIIPKRESLILRRPHDFKETYNIDVRIQNEVIQIDRDQKRVEVKNLKTGERYFETYDKLLLSPGAKAFTPPFTNPDQLPIHTLKTIPDMDRIMKELENNRVKQALVLGGGFIGLEVAENLIHLGIETHLVELSNQVMTSFDLEMSQLLHHELHNNGVHLYLQNRVESIQKTDSGQMSINLQDNRQITVDIIISAVGVTPESILAKEAQLALNERGAIVVNNQMMTSDPDIYAVGDAVQTTHFIDKSATMLPLAGPANREARIAADNICGISSHYQGAQGTSILKLFELTAASTGINEKYALKNEIAYETLYLHPFHHVTYYPGSSQLTIKILYQPKTFQLLGAQVIGKKGVDKKIDILATVMRSELTLLDLQDIEFAYAPPYGAAKDPINMIGFMAENIKRGLVQFYSPAKLSSEERKKWQIVDVRTPDEYKLGHIEGALNIPLQKLREGVSQLDPQKPTLVYCAVGIRSYNAYRILSQSGIAQLYNLSGGYKNYLNFFPTAIERGTSTKLQKSVNTSTATQSKTCHELNLLGLQCPGPIVALKQKLDSLRPGEEVKAIVSDKGFAKDIVAFCESTGNSFNGITKAGDSYTASIIKGGQENLPITKVSKKTIVVFSNELDRAMASFIIANGARAMGSEVTLFFTFWGLTLLKKEGHDELNHNKKAKKSWLEKFFSFMLPKGTKGLALSKMNMMGMGPLFMKFVMRQKNVNTLRELIDMAVTNGVKLTACSMSMEIMGIKEHELIKGVEIAGVTDYLGQAQNADTNLFI